MNIAVINPSINPGGGARYEKALLLGIARNFPDAKISYFGDMYKLKREGLKDIYENNGFLCTNYLKFNAIKSKIIFIPFTFLFNKLSRKIFKYRYKNFLSRINATNDIAFFPWPYGFNCPELTIPMVCVPHDLNFKYYFGQRIFSLQQVKNFNENLISFFYKSQIVVSSEFMATELKRFYSDFADKVSVIHLAPFSLTTKISKKEIQFVLNKFSINYRYIIAPTNITYHKNIGMLLSAFYLLRNNNHNIKLILTGPGTDGIIGQSHENGLIESNDNWDVIGLGYIENNEIDILIKNAEIVVNCSLYEAGNGSGIDAWKFGRPVAMSNIPSFTEHMRILNVHAEIFDPRNVYDIAEKIERILLNPDHSKQLADDSMTNINTKANWDTVAQKYYNVFNNAITKRDSN